MMIYSLGIACSGCGTCIALCPNRALTLEIDKSEGIYIPKLNEKKCTLCKLCIKVCPSNVLNHSNIYDEVFHQRPTNALAGVYLSSFVGHSTDYNVRFNSTSGGLVTQLLIYALESGIIDGALVTRMRKNNPLEPEPFIARSAAEIIEATGSKYCPVPVNIALREIIDSNRDEKFAVVGTPCHILGVRKAESLYPKLKKKIILHIGLFCSHTLNFSGLEFLIKKLNIKKAHIQKINFRGQGWPGKVSIILKNGSSKIDIKNYELLLFKPRFFTPKYCMLCTDALCEMADLSFGDPWLPEYKNEKIGKSLVICRTQIGYDLLRSAQLNSKIILQNIPISKVLQATAKNIYYKKKTSKIIFAIYKSIYKKVYISNFELLMPSLVDYLIAPLFCFNIWISTKRFLWPIVSIATEIEWHIGHCLRRL